MNRRVPLILSALLLASLACNFPGLPGASTPTETPTPSSVPKKTKTPTSTPLPPTPTPPLPTATLVTLSPPTLTSPPPLLTPPANLKGPYAVVLVPGDQVLNVRLGVGIASPIIDKLDAKARYVYLTGEERMVGSQRWVQLQRPAGGLGWVSSYYLTEQIAPQVFCSDARVNPLLDQLDSALAHSDGEAFSRLLSPAHGLILKYLRTGLAVSYTPVNAKWLFQSNYVTDWGAQPASGQPLKAKFREEVLPKLQEVFTSSSKRICNEIQLGPSSYQFQWPSEYANFNFYSVYKPGSPGTEQSWRTWLVGFEYVKGQPYPVVLLHLFWEP